MKNVYKCNGCEYGPCYCCTSYKPDQANFFGEEEPADLPHYCPYFSDSESPEWEITAPEMNPTNIQYIDKMQEWINGEGYDNAPEELRDGIVACDLFPPRFPFQNLMYVFNFLRNYEENTYSADFEMEDMQKQLNKIKKSELIAAIFPEAFKAGIIYGEILRQKREQNNRKDDQK